MAYPAISLRLELQQVPPDLHEHTYGRHSPHSPFDEDSEWVQCDECLDWILTPVSPKDLIPTQNHDGGVQ
jgi:hypothetical protein